MRHLAPLSNSEASNLLPFKPVLRFQTQCREHHCLCLQPHGVGSRPAHLKPYGSRFVSETHVEGHISQPLKPAAGNVLGRQVSSWRHCSKRNSHIDYVLKSKVSCSFSPTHKPMEPHAFHLFRLHPLVWPFRSRKHMIHAALCAHLKAFVKNKVINIDVYEFLLQLKCGAAESNSMFLQIIRRL